MHLRPPDCSFSPVFALFIAISTSIQLPHHTTNKLPCIDAASSRSRPSPNQYKPFQSCRLPRLLVQDDQASWQPSPGIFIAKKGQARPKDFANDPFPAKFKEELRIAIPAAWEQPYRRRETERGMNRSPLLPLPVTLLEFALPLSAPSWYASVAARFPAFSLVRTPDHDQVCRSRLRSL